MPVEANIDGYHKYWLGMKGGRAGVALYTKVQNAKIEISTTIATHLLSTLFDLIETFVNFTEITI